MKLQRMLGNGSWIDDERIDMFIARVLEREPRMSVYEKRQPMTTSQEVMDLLATGRGIRHGDDWYANIRDADAQPIRKSVPVKLVGCDCGHSVPVGGVMNASLGTSCPECYDQMSY